MRTGKSQGRTTLRKYKHSHQRGAHAQSPNGFTGNLFAPVQQSRILMSWVTKRWRDVLTAGQRTAWDTLAAAQTVVLNDGPTVHLTGQKLYAWRIACNRETFYTPGNKATDLALPFFDAVPALWNPPTAPIVTAFNFWDTVGAHLHLQLDNPIAVSGFSALATVANPHMTQTKKGSYVDTLVFLQNTPPLSAIWTFSIFWTGALRKVSDLYENTVVLRVMSDFPDLVPSNPTFHKLGHP